ncbi:hypothetical protein ACJA23_01990 [Mycoplasma corogypsi]|uniref:hypothetical protein n=1 Tax=Mycoplasma corogypsi TaxID=2106 RepID=UPI003873C5A7
MFSVYKSQLPWEILISEFVALFLLVLASYTATFLGKTHQKYRFIFASFYGASVFVVPLIGVGLFRLLTHLSATDKLIQVDNVTTVVNPMNSLFYIFIELFLSLSRHTKANLTFSNIMILMVVHLSSVICASVVWYFIRKRYKFDHFLQVPNVFNYDQTLKNIGLSIFFIGALFGVQMMSRLHQTSIFLNAFLTAFILFCCLMFASYVLNIFSFPSNIYVSLSRYFMILVYHRNFFLNTVAMAETTLTYTMFTCFFSVFAIVIL